MPCAQSSARCPPTTAWPHRGYSNILIATCRDSGRRSYTPSRRHEVHTLKPSAARRRKLLLLTSPSLREQALGVRRSHNCSKVHHHHLPVCTSRPNSRRYSCTACSRRTGLIFPVAAQWGGGRPVAGGAHAAGAGSMVVRGSVSSRKRTGVRAQRAPEKQDVRLRPVQCIMLPATCARIGVGGAAKRCRKGRRKMRRLLHGSMLSTH